MLDKLDDLLCSIMQCSLSSLIYRMNERRNCLVHYPHESTDWEDTLYFDGLRNRLNRCFVQNSWVSY